MKNDKYDGFEIINIPAPSAEERRCLSEYTIVYSPWITYCNGITGEYFQYHRDTGERREVPVDWWAGPVITNQ